MDLALDPAAFLRDHWQTRPRLIRNAWPGWRNPFAPDELAGLACEDGVAARLVTRGRRTWQVAHGPFRPKRFAGLGAKPWTLLVDAVDRVVPDVAALREAFAFIPSWRIDDVMVSYASDGGGVGPHFDRYDVFLIQGLGRRRWRIGGRCDAATPRLPHDDLNLLAAFEPTDDWVLDPGDMLYLPPGIAHDGVAVGDDCMTYSIGFRAPSRSELLAHWCDHLLASLDDDDRYADPDLTVPSNPGEIAPAAIARLHAMVTGRLADRAAFARWFGEYTTHDDGDRPPAAAVAEADVRAAIAAGRTFTRHPASRVSFIRGDGATVVLFVDGASFECTGEGAAVAEVIAAAPRFTPTPAWADAPDTVALLAALVGSGSVAIADR